MISWTLGASLALAVGGVTAFAAVQEGRPTVAAPGWLMNLDEARARAQKEKKPIFLVFR